MAENKQVLFKLGSQSNLNSLLVSKNKNDTNAAIPGAFYVTNDTHRLYFGIADTANTTKVVPLNQGVITVGSVDDLKDPVVGQFYYLSSPSNVLCVYNGDSWIQINTDTHISEHTVAVGAGSTTNSATVTSTVTDTKSTTYSDTWSLIGGDHIAVTVGSKTLTIACDIKYELSINSISTGGAKVSLTENTDGNAGTFNIKGANDIDVTVDSGNTTITIDGKKIKEAAAGKAVTGVEVEFDDDGKLLAAVSQSDGTRVVSNGSAIPKIILEGKQDAYIFKQGTATLPIYTKSEIDKFIRDLDAVHYMGVISTSTIPAGNYRKGDAYKTGIDKVEYRDSTGTKQTTKSAGDLLIANGTEDSTTGFITSTSLYWDYVPSGDDSEDTQYIGDRIRDGGSNGDEHGIAIKEQNGNGTEIARLTVKALNGDSNKWIAVDSVGTSTTENTITIAHKNGAALSTPSTSDTKQSAGNEKTIKFVSGISVDEANHITGYNITESTFVDTNSVLSTNAVTLADSTVSGAADAVKLTHTVATTDGAGTITSIEAAYNLVSTNNCLTLDADDTNKKISFGLVWGTF